jgi:hypothetical protein
MKGFERMTAKYQIFVSSTFADLEEERNLIIKAVLEMGHIPVGMEMFSAADEEQWSIIKKQIDQSDYYIVIAAHRYGSLGPSGLSYTEMEYDYAVSKGIPTLGFVLDAEADWPKDKSDSGTKTIQKLNAFKAKIKNRPVSFWRNKDDLYGKCSIALMKAFNAYPREGWVRASTVQDAAASKEVIRLSVENAEFRQRLAAYEAHESKKKTLDEVIVTLKANKRQLQVFKKADAYWSDGPALTLYQIFETVAPELQVEADIVSLARYFATNLSRVPHNELRTTWPTPRNLIRSILADFAALGCIVPSKRKKPVSDTNEYWCLGEFGVDLLAHMRKRRLEHVEKLAKIDTAPETEEITK